ncbi:MAG: PD-(D/E)XK nuclease family protein, partial [Bacteroidia bacterium]|nr:PD-(D/E)XK nuclease family protein [Bacteroidia bacterium]
KYKASFQLLFYNLLVKTKDPVAQTKAGLYMMRELQEGIAFLNEGEALSQQIADEFEQNLNLLIEEIFNVELPFTQTEDRKRCEYCPYKDICKR